jgi:hypothetical protein
MVSAPAVCFPFFNRGLAGSLHEELKSTALNTQKQKTSSK